MSSHDTMNPNGGVDMGHVMDSSNPDEHTVKELWVHIHYPATAR